MENTKRDYFYNTACRQEIRCPGNNDFLAHTQLSNKSVWKMKFPDLSTVKSFTSGERLFLAQKFRGPWFQQERWWECGRGGGGGLFNQKKDFDALSSLSSSPDKNAKIISLLSNPTKISNIVLESLIYIWKGRKRPDVGNFLQPSIWKPPLCVLSQAISK